MLVLVPTESHGADRPVGAVSREELLARVAGGDRGAFALLYDDIAARVLGVVKRVLVDHAQSEEVVQEVFLEIWQHAAKYQPEKGGASTWITTMAHRRAVDRVRSSQAGRDRDVRIGVRDIEHEYDSVSEEVEIRLENERVQRALAQLTDLQRQAVTLAYYKGMSHSEVSDLLKVPIGTVKTRLRDGMIRLRDAMGVTA